MKKLHLPFLALTALLASCGAGVPIIVDHTKTVDVSRQLTTQPTCNSPVAYQAAVDVTFKSSPATSELRGILSFHDDSLLAYGQVVDVQTGASNLYVRKFTADLKDSPWSFDGLNATNLQSNGNLLVPLTGTVFNRSQPVLAGSRKENTWAYTGGFVERFKGPSGGLDATFGQGGIADVTFGTNAGDKTEVKSLYIDPGGSTYVAAEYTRASTGTRYMAVSKLTLGGQPDPSFAGNGRLLLDPALGNTIVKIEGQGNGGVVLLTRTGSDMRLVRLTGAGLLDYSGIGLLINLDFQGVDVPTDLLRTSDGYLIAGITEKTTGAGPVKRIALAKLKPDLTFDSSFGQAGKLEYSNPKLAMNLQQIRANQLVSGCLLISGYYNNSTPTLKDQHLFYSALLPNGSIDTNFQNFGWSTAYEASQLPTLNGTLVQNYAFQGSRATYNYTRILSVGQAEGFSHDPSGLTNRRGFLSCNLATLIN